MEEHENTRVAFQYEGGIEIWDIEEILNDNSRNYSNPTQIDQSQLVKTIKFVG